MTWRWSWPARSRTRAATWRKSDRRRRPIQLQGRPLLHRGVCRAEQVLTGSVPRPRTLPGASSIRQRNDSPAPQAAQGRTPAARHAKKKKETLLAWFVPKKRIVLGWPGWRETNSRRKKVGPSQSRVSLVRTPGGSGSPHERIQGNKPIRPVSASQSPTTTYLLGPRRTQRESHYR